MSKIIRLEDNGMDIWFRGLIEESLKFYQKHKTEEFARAGIRYTTDLLEQLKIEEKECARLKDYKSNRNPGETLPEYEKRTRQKVPKPESPKKRKKAVKKVKPEKEDLDLNL